MSDKTLAQLDQIRANYLALLERIETITLLQQQLKTAGLCNGSEYWRKEDGKPDRLYANHGEGQVCDIHGQHKHGYRLRKYIGSNPGKIKECMDMMERYREWRRLENQKDEIQDKTSLLKNRINHISMYLL